jgi:antitoxin ParD1/3/4
MDAHGEWWTIAQLRADDEHLAGMIDGMTMTKIAVSLPAGLVEQAQRAVAEGRAASVSAYVARALEEQAKLDDLASLLDEMLAETGGALIASELKAADRALGR